MHPCHRYRLHIRAFFALVVTLVGLSAVPYNPASAAGENNDIEKTGVAQSPAGSTTETLENTLIDWTIEYSNDADEIQTDGQISDTPSANLAIVSGSTQQPPGWTPTLTGTSKVQWDAPKVTPRGKGFAISSEPTSTTLAGGAGGGDGYVPLFGDDGRIYFTYHHNAGTIQCIDPDLGAVCAGYPMAMNINTGGQTGRMWTPNASPAIVLGNRLYQSGFVAGTPNATYGLGCWDLPTRTNCADQPFITYPHPTGFGNMSGTNTHTFAQGPFVIGDNMYTWTSHQEVQCVNIPSWSMCGGYPKSMLNPTTFPRVTANGLSGGQVVGTQIFYMWAFSVSSETPALSGMRAACFDTATGDVCTGWDDGLGNPDGKIVPTNNGSIWDPILRYDSAGDPDAFCQVSYTNTAGCVSLGNGSVIPDTGADVNGIPNALYSAIHYGGTNSGVISSAKHPDLPRSYFSSYPASNELCWDWSTSDFCTTISNSGDLNYIDTAPGDGYVGDNGRIRPGNVATKDYGARYDPKTGCWWSLGDANILWSFDDLGNAPCVPRLVEADGASTFAGSFCRSGVPDDIAWTKSRISNFDPANWNTFTVTVKDGANTVGTYDAKAGVYELDLSGVDAQAIDTLQYEINGTMAAGQYPLEDEATTPIVTIEFDTESGVEFCYQTRTVGDPCVATTAVNNAAIRMGTGPVEDTSTQSFDVIANPVGKCFTPAMTLDKTIYRGHNNGASCDGAESVLVREGDPVTWCFTVTNTGDAVLDSVQITDPQLPNNPAPIDVPGPIGIGASASVFVDGTAGPDDLLNTATVNAVPVDVAGTPIPGAEPPSDEDTSDYDVRTPSVNLAKTSYAGHNDGASCPGMESATSNGEGPITWCFTVTNTGDTELTDLSIADPLLPGGPFPVPGPIAAGGSASTYVEGTVSTDMTNEATVTGTPSDGTGTPIPEFPKVTADDEAEVDIINPAIELAKTVSADGTCPGAETAVVDAGDPVTWCFSVTNTGDTHLNNPSVSDPDLPGSPFTITGLVAPGATVSTSAPGVASADLTNTATATGIPANDAGVEYPDSVPPTDDDDAKVDVVTPGIEIAKTVVHGSDPAACPGQEKIESLADVDDPVTWCFTVTNTGDTHLTDAQITDPQLPGSPFDVGTLAPGASATRTAPGIATADLLNTATATGTPADAAGDPLPDVEPPSHDDTAEIDEVPPASIGGRLFVDHNADGDDETGGDDGLGGVEVTITGIDSNGDMVSRTVETNPDGSYSFGGLLPSGPDGYTVTVDESTVPPQYTIDTTPMARTTVVSAGDNTPQPPMGVAAPATINGTVFGDDNSDGTRGNGDDGVGGVIVTITGLDFDGNEVTRSATTNPDGTYSFPDLPPSGPDGYTVALDESSIPPNFTGVSTAVTDTLVVGSGDTKDVIPFGLVEPGSISGSLFNDINGDGDNEGGDDPNLGGVEVTVTGLDTDGNEVTFTTTTDPDGTYTFPGLPPSGPDGYTVAVNPETLPPDLRTPSTPLTQNVDVTGGNETAAPPMGVFGLSTASGTVFNDFDQDGVQDEGEDGLGGVTVTLEGVDGQGNPVLLTTTTNPDGTYSFGDIPPSGPDGYVVQSDPSTFPEGSGDVTTPPSRTINPTSGSDHPNLDTGVFNGSDVSGQVFVDPNSNGGVDGDERGIGGIVVTITGVDVNGNPVTLTTTTNPDGTYTFPNLPPSGPDGYKIEVDASTVPPEYTLTSTPQSATVNVSGGKDVDVEPFGILEPAKIHGAVFNDRDDDGVRGIGEEGVPGVKVCVTGLDINGNGVSECVTTGPDGSYIFPNLPPSGPDGYTVSTDPDTVPVGVNIAGGDKTVVVASGEDVEVLFGSAVEPDTPDVTTTTTSPESTPDTPPSSNDNAPSTPDAAPAPSVPLARTGVSVGGLLFVATSTIVLGGLFLVVRKRA